jgi:hypothetical protein
MTVLERSISSGVKPARYSSVRSAESYFILQILARMLVGLSAEPEWGLSAMNAVYASVEAP